MEEQKKTQTVQISGLKAKLLIIVLVLLVGIVLVKKKG